MPGLPPRSEFRKGWLKRFGWLAALLLGLSPTARADDIIHHWESYLRGEGDLLLEGLGNLYSSSANYDLNGASSPLLTAQEYQRSQLDLDASYGFSQDFTAFARLSWARVELQSAQLGGNSFGFADQSLGASYKAWNSKHSFLSLQAQGDFPFYVNDGTETNANPVLGDGSVDLTVGAFFRYVIEAGNDRAVALTGGEGYTYRTVGYSSAIPWSLEARYLPGSSGLTGALGFFGSQSLDTDRTTLSATRLVATGGSLFSNSVNATLTTVRAEMGYRADSGLSIFVRAERSIGGQFAPIGTNLGFGLRYSIAPGRSRGRSDSGRTGGEGASNQGLLSYSIEARVTAVGSEAQTVTINKGNADRLERGQVFDFFRQINGAFYAIARGKIVRLQETEATLQITELFRRLPVKIDDQARLLIQ